MISLMALFRFDARIVYVLSIGWLSLVLVCFADALLVAMRKSDTGTSMIFDVYLFNLGFSTLVYYHISFQ